MPIRTTADRHESLFLDGEMSRGQLHEAINDLRAVNQMLVYDTNDARADFTRPIEQLNQLKESLQDLKQWTEILEARLDLAIEKQQKTP